MPCTAPAGTGRDAGEARTLQAIALADQPHAAAPGPRRRGLFVDCETTGFSSEHDALIELAMLPFTYTLEGAITDVHRDQGRTWRQDPGRPVPAARDAAWACSRHEVPWDPAVFPSRSLAYLLCAYGAFSPDRHRALADCEAGVWLLTQTLPGTDRTVFGALRERAATPAVRILAAGAPVSSS